MNIYPITFDKNNMWLKLHDEETEMEIYLPQVDMIGNMTLNYCFLIHL